MYYRIYKHDKEYPIREKFPPYPPLALAYTCLSNIST